jgi:hypothetical protein
MNKNNKYIIITSIFSPTEAVKKFSKKRGWKLIVVGDEKTPQKWEQENSEFFSIQNQKKLDFKIIKLLPSNHYSRKMIGYLHAIKNGAEVIADTDDDNIPLNNWGKFDFKNRYTVASKVPYINVYNLYLEARNIWPRGYPLSMLSVKNDPVFKIKNVSIGIWQFLVNKDPDVDAIYRLTNNKPTYFKKGAEPIVLEKGCLCPINSQNTFFTKETFPLLYLPAYVNFRVTDILRGYIAQIILWESNLKIGFGTASAIQERNPHNYLKDFESEIPLYIHSEKIIDVIKNSIKKDASISENLVNCYKGLYLANFVQKKELDLLNSWIKDIKKIK